MEDSTLVPDTSEQEKIEGSIYQESQSKQIANNTPHSESPPKETSEFLNDEKISNDEKQSRSSAFSNEHAILETHASTDQQIGQNLNAGNHLLPCDKEIRTPSKYPDKALEDGYTWRKYGQKFVKGNEFVRSYYRCTHPNCRAKRQVECSHDGRITDTVYIGKHEHFIAQPRSTISSIELDGGPLATKEDKSSDAHGPASTSHEEKTMGNKEIIPAITPTKNVTEGSNSQPVQSKLTRDEINHDGDPPLKKQKKFVCDVDETPGEKPYGEPRFVGEPRVVVQTMSEVDILQDGYRWRKYGQKLVKGNPNPRSYYRCSSSGCPAKKHVERAAHDAKAVITTYEGQHDHDMPPARTVTPNRGGALASATPVKDISTSEPEDKNTVGLEMTLHVGAK